MGNLGWSTTLDRTIDPAQLRHIILQIAQRHEPLRTSFTLRNRTITGVVSPASAFQLAQTDLTDVHEDIRELEFKRVAEQETAKRFELDGGPLWRFRLVRMSGSDWRLIYVAHRIIFDQLSAVNFDTELAAYLAAETTGTPKLPPLPTTYFEYAAEQRIAFADDQFRPHLKYWRAALAELPVETGLPTDRPRPAERTYRGNELDLALSPELTQELTALAQRHGTTLFIVLLAGFVTLLHRYLGQRDIVLGTAVAGRESPETAALLGAFTNNLVLRFDIRDDLTFADVLFQVRERVRTAECHGDIPFAKVVEAVDPERDLSRPPLYQIGFNALPPCASDRISTATTELDLNIDVTPADSGPPRITVQYAIDLFDAETVSRLSASYRTLLTSAAADETRTVVVLDVLPERERRLLSAWAGPSRRYPRGLLHRLVLDQAAACRDAPAMGYGGRWLTYGELAARACRTARWLGLAGVRPGTVVGVCLTRGPDLLPTILGILTAGCAYLPLEPDHPAERLRGMLSDTRARHIVTTSAFAARLPMADDRRILLLDTARASIDGQSPAPPEVLVPPDSLAYVMFTSGSTGHPKGIGISHTAILNRLCWMQEEFALDHVDRVLHKTPYTFDVSVWELFWPLLAGAGVVIAAPGAHADPEYLAQLITRERVTVAHFVPSRLESFLEYPDLLGLDRVICSGEVLSPQLAARCFERLPGVRLYNLYGPTEAAIDVSWHRCVPGEQRIPIGRPVANTRLEVLDQGLRRVPIGAVGGLYVGGAQLAEGYIGRPDLAAAHFVDDPCGPPGTRLYRTGDLARWRGNGEVEFLGRDDDQVKIRGVRIEPGEVQAVLESHPNVDRAVVTFREDAPEGPGLVAYVRWTGAPDSLADVLRGHLRTRLPMSMIPAAFVRVPRFPVLPSGKLDRAALPAPTAQPPPVSGHVAPRTPMELVLCGIWTELLGRPDIGVTDSFFALGGDSLLAIGLIDRINTTFDVALAPRRCFELGTVADYALAILDLQLQLARYDVDELIEAIRSGGAAS